jgi:signal transduction histidine kinase
VLMGGDRRTHELCRDILAESRSVRELRVVSEDVEPPAADIYIWDHRPGLEKIWGPRVTNGGRHVLLIEPQHLAASGLGDLGGVAVVLKPVTKAALSAWLCQAGAEGRVARLRRDRDELLQWLMEANLRLQEYDRERTDFLARTVHDFRAPLMSSCGYCGLLVEGELGPLTEEQREVLERVQTSLKRLSRMTAAMFELSIGQRVDRTPKLERADIRESIEQALHEIGPIAGEKRIDMRVALTPPGSALRFEPGQLEQVVLNLFENACKFTPRAGRIEVRGYECFWERRSSRVTHVPNAERRRRADGESNAYRVEIANSGPAIPSERLNRIFEEYATYSAGEACPGGGLGLAICKAIIQRHNGKIWAENREGGPVLSFVLPFQPETQGAAPEGKAIRAYQVRGVV